MGGAAKQLWGYYPGPPPVWIPLQVDSNGYVKVDMSAINLDDLADVSVAAPADDDLFYYDDATGLWKSRKLVDDDIPAGIARDAEVTAAVAAEAAARDAAIAAVNLDDLADVSVAAPADGQLVRWDAGNARWQKMGSFTTPGAGLIQSLVSSLIFRTTEIAAHSIDIESWNGAANILVCRAMGGVFFLYFARLGGDLLAAGNKITGLGDPAAAQDADTQAARNAAIAAIVLNDLGDVTITSPTARQLLSYDSVAAAWKNRKAGMMIQLSPEGDYGTEQRIITQAPGISSPAYPYVPVTADRHIAIREIASAADSLTSYLALTGYVDSANGVHAVSPIVDFYKMFDVGSTSRNATISSISTVYITLTGNEAGRFFFDGMAGKCTCKIVNKSKDPLQYAWVTNRPALNMLTVTNAADISTWVNGETISTERLPNSPYYRYYEIDLSSQIPAGCLGVFLYAQVSDDG